MSHRKTFKLKIPMAMGLVLKCLQKSDCNSPIAKAKALEKIFF